MRVVVYLAWLTASLGAFLSAKLPLRALSVSPTGSALQGRDAVTVVFSRPVIALGSDFGDNATLVQPFFLLERGTGRDMIPLGKFRWVTTYIARFDLDDEWPTDLELELSVPTDLQCYDGARLDLANSVKPRQYSTPSLAWYLSSVSSQKAQQLTDNHWTGSDVSPPECPPDAVVQLTFTSPVSPQLLQAAIMLSDEAGARLPTPQLSPCNANESGLVTCVFVRPQLQAGAKCTLSLPAKTRYNHDCGLSAQPLALKLQGLLPFQFQHDEWSRPAHTRQLLWLRHGLKPGVTASTLQKALTIQTNGQPVPFNLSFPNAYSMAVTAQFQPSTVV
jgi:hypothetical protein